MGWNSIVVVNHDRLNDIAKTPNYGEQLAHAISSYRYITSGQPVGTKVVASDHANGRQVVLVGDCTGRYITSLDYGSCSLHDPIKLIADQVRVALRPRVLQSLHDDYDSASLVEQAAALHRPKSTSVSRARAILAEAQALHVENMRLKLENECLKQQLAELPKAQL